MKWTQWVALPFLLCLSFSLFLMLSPLIWTAFVHSALPGWMSILRERLRAHLKAGFKRASTASGF